MHPDQALLRPAAPRLKILYYTFTSFPNVGGIEVLIDLICTELARLGHEVVLVTRTPGDEDAAPYRIVRNPDKQTHHQLIDWCDVNLHANVNMHSIPTYLHRPGKHIFQHNNTYSKSEYTKDVARITKRFLARRFPGIAVSAYVARTLGCKTVIWNCYDPHTFHSETRQEDRPVAFAFVGRLVLQKGCDLLLRALAQIPDLGNGPELTIIGGGAERVALEQLAGELGISSRVEFRGILRGKALNQELNRHRYLVVPSRYEEPFGIAALEGLAAGCIPVVSRNGGLIEAVSDLGFPVANGDVADLARTLARARAGEKPPGHSQAAAEEHLRKFHPATVAREYEAAFYAHLGLEPAPGPAP